MYAQNSPHPSRVEAILRASALLRLVAVFAVYPHAHCAAVSFVRRRLAHILDTPRSDAETATAIRAAGGQVEGIDTNIRIASTMQNIQTRFPELYEVPAPNGELFLEKRRAHQTGSGK